MDAKVGHGEFTPHGGDGEVIREISRPLMEGKTWIKLLAVLLIIDLSVIVGLEPISPEHRLPTGASTDHRSAPRRLLRRALSRSVSVLLTSHP